MVKETQSLWNYDPENVRVQTVFVVGGVRKMI